MTERAWQQQVLQLAALLGWSYYHTHDSRRSNPGFPDLVLWRDRVVFAELKGEKTRVSPEQKRTLGALSQAGAEAYLWRPQDFDDVKEALT